MVKKFDVFFCEVRGTEKPCIVVSPDEVNDLLPYVLVAPITVAMRGFPFRVGVKLKGQTAQIALDLMRPMPKEHLKKRIGTIPPPLQEEILKLLKELLINH